MTKRKKIIIFTILFFFLFFNFIRPKVIIHGSDNNSAEVSVVMDVFDKEYNGDVSIWYMNKIKSSTSDYSLLNKETVIIDLLYFWKVEIFLKENGEIEKSYIYKYPWSHKQFFNI